MKHQIRLRARKTSISQLNGEKFLLEQLNSIKQQTTLPYELVVTDDGSSDNTIKIIEEFKSASPFPVSIHINTKNLGFADNFIKAASLCQGDWIAFCDQDDYWLPNKLERISNEIIQNNTFLAIAHTSRITDHKLNATGKFCPYFKKDSILKPLSLPPWTIVEGFSLIVSKEVLSIYPSNKRPFDHAAPSGKLIGHDQWYLLLASTFGPVKFISEPLAYYRQHSSNVTGAGQTGGLRFNLEKSLTVNKSHYDSLSKIANHRAIVFHSIELSIKNHYFQHLAGLAEKRYNRLHNWLKIRSEIHSSSNLKSISKILKLCSELAYRRKSSGGLGIKAFFKDALHILT